MFIDDLYSINKLSETEIEVFLGDAEHPIFKAHFPNNPILPAFIHLEIITDIFNVHLIAIKKAKFNAFIVPLQKLLYIKNANKIMIKCDEQVVASFTIVQSNSI